MGTENIKMDIVESKDKEVAERDGVSMVASKQS